MAGAHAVGDPAVPSRGPAKGPLTVAADPNRNTRLSHRPGSEPDIGDRVAAVMRHSLSRPQSVDDLEGLVQQLGTSGRLVRLTERGELLGSSPDPHSKDQPPLAEEIKARCPGRHELRPVPGEG